MKNLQGKVAVITGAGSGIGRALAIQMAKLGSKLALNDFDEKGLKETVRMLNEAEVFHEVLDVSNKQDMINFAENVIKTYGKVDIVINNAGVALGKKTLLQTEYNDFEWLMDINFWGTVYGTKAFLPHLLKEHEASIVNISSIFGIVGIAEQVPYCASKFAVRGFNESLRMEMARKKVTVSSVHPGGIKTNIARNSKGWEGVKNKDKSIARMENELFINTPEYAANVIIKGIQKKKEKILIGRDARFLDKLARLFSVGYTKIIFSQIRKFDKA